jgi:hypothetical protein
MGRRWFWPLLLSGVLLFSVSVGFLWSLLLLYSAFDAGLWEMPVRVTDGSTIQASYYIDVSPITYAITTVASVAGATLLIAASRLR